MKSSTFAAALALCTLPAIGLAQDAPELPTDERIREAWSYLRPDEQAEITEWFRAEVSYLDTYQGKLIQYLLDTSEVDRGLFAEPEPLPYYDPAKHAPAQPIKRKRLDADNRKAEKEYERLVGQFDADPLRRAWRYDWASGEILRVGEERDPELLFENAMLGLPPLIDLAEAMLQQRLDDGSQREALAAFGHAYTDRNGNLFPNITLYDAWCSGQEIEMPDVDVLGIVHDLWDEWKKWKAPIPTSQHKKLYAKVGDVLVEAKHHRQLREALAASYLRGKAVAGDLYKPNNLAFNGLWDEFNSDPAALFEDLPQADDWEKYLKDLTSRIARKKKFREAGQVRLDYLEADRWRTKNTLVWVLTEFGAFDRTELPPPPKPKPKPKPAPKPEEGGA